MSIKSVLLCFMAVFLVAVSSQALHQSFLGQWTDKTTFGTDKNNGTTFVCVEGDNIYAAFSEFGVAQGTMLGATVTGFYYKAGGSAYPYPSFGTFTWTLSLDGMSFRGVYTRDGSTETLEWNEQRIDFEYPTMRQCARIADVGTGTVRGSWFNDYAIADFCFLGPNFDSSFIPGNGIAQGKGYQVGDIHASGIILSGVVAQSFPPGLGEEYAEGATLNTLLQDGSLLTYAWVTPIGVYPKSIPPHLTYISRRTDSNATTEDCARYDYVRQISTDTFSVPLYLSSSSNDSSLATHLIATTLTLLVALVLLL